MFFFVTGCGAKIQKNSSFKPHCEEKDHLSSQILCNVGKPSCGTRPGSGELVAYCINDDDRILGQAMCGYYLNEVKRDEETISNCEQIITNNTE